MSYTKNCSHWANPSQLCDEHPDYRIREGISRVYLPFQTELGCFQNNHWIAALGVEKWRGRRRECFVSLFEGNTWDFLHTFKILHNPTEHWGWVGGAVLEAHWGLCKGRAQAQQGPAQLHSWCAEDAEHELAKFSTCSEVLERPPQRKGCPKTLGTALGSGWGAEGPGPAAAGGHELLWGVWGESFPLCSTCDPLGSIWDPPVICWAPLSSGIPWAPSGIPRALLGSPIPIPRSGSGSLQDPIPSCCPGKSSKGEAWRYQSATKTGGPSEESSQNLIFMIILIIFLLQNEAEKLEMHK